MRPTAANRFLLGMLETEIMPYLSLPQEELKTFFSDELRRFANPFILHRWHDISLNGIANFAQLRDTAADQGIETMVHTTWPTRFWRTSLAIKPLVSEVTAAYKFLTEEPFSLDCLDDYANQLVPSDPQNRNDGNPNNGCCHLLFLLPLAMPTTLTSDQSAPIA